MGLYPSPLAENNSPSTPYNGPNVSQYGWTEQETGYYVQLIEYVEKCEDILDECEDIRDSMQGQSDQVEDIYNEILLIKQDMDDQMAEFNEDLAGFELKYADFIAKYNQIITLYNEIVLMHQEVLNAAAIAVASATTAINASDEAEGYAQTALGYAQAADFDAAFASDEADRAQSYAEMLEHPYEDMGTHTIIQGYPTVPSFSSMWNITDGGPDPVDPAIIWNPGDHLIYSTRTGLWSRLTGQALGGGGTVPIEILDDLIMQQGKKIRFRVDEFVDHVSMSLDSDGDLVVGEIPTTDNTITPVGKIGLAATELYHITGMGTGSVTTKYRIYDEGFKPTPAAIGAVKKAGDTMTGNLTAPMVKVVANPTAPEDLANKGYVDSVAGSSTMFGETPPVGVDVGTMWYCTENGLTYLLYDDGNSTQWIEANPNYPVAVGDHDHDQYVLKAGDVIYADLVVQAPGECGIALGTTPTSSNISFLGEDGIRTTKIDSITNGELTFTSVNQTNNQLQTTYIHWNPAINTVEIFNPTTSTPQQAAVNSLTRRDYVDGTFVNKAGDTVSGLLKVDGSFESVAGARGNFRLKRGYNNVSGDDVVDFLVDDTGLTIIVDNDLDADSGTCTFQRMVGGVQEQMFQISYDGTIYANESNRVYHQGFKPTPADVGAAPTVHTHTEYLPKTGGTITGGIYASFLIARGGPDWRVDGGISLEVESPTKSYIGLNGTYHALSFYSDDRHAEFAGNVAANATAPTLPHHLTRKDYVDLGLLAKADVTRVDTVEETLLSRIASLEARIAQLEGGA